MSNDQSQTDASRKVVQNMYDSALAGDNAAFFGSLADNLLVMEPQFLPYGGKHHGVAGFVFPPHSSVYNNHRYFDMHSDHRHCTRKLPHADPVDNHSAGD